MDGIKRIYPREVVSYDVELIILMSDAAQDMWEQLYRIGYNMEKVVHYKDYFEGFAQEIKAISGTDCAVSKEKST